jgi:hypothetical protein
LPGGNQEVRAHSIDLAKSASGHVVPEESEGPGSTTPHP